MMLLDDYIYCYDIPLDDFSFPGMPVPVPTLGHRGDGSRAGLFSLAVGQAADGMTFVGAPVPKRAKTSLWKI